MAKNKLPININKLLHQCTIENERVEYKIDWNPESVIHTLCVLCCERVMYASTPAR